MSRSLFFLSLFFFLYRGEESLLFPLERRRGRTQTPCARVAHANAAVGVRFLPGQTETRLCAAAAAGSARGAGEDPAAAASRSGLFVWKRRWRTRLSEAGDSGRLARARQRAVAPSRPRAAAVGASPSAVSGRFGERAFKCARAVD